MKKLLVICGSGIATSTVVMGKVKSWLEDEGLINQVELFQDSVQGAFTHFDDYDCVVSTTIVPAELRDKVIDGVALLTGMGTDGVYAAIKEKLA